MESIHKKKVSNSSNCEIKIIKDQAPNFEFCKFEHFSSMYTYWSHLKDNNWLFSATNETLNIDCQGQIISEKLTSAGILTIDKNCTTYTNSFNLMDHMDQIKNPPNLTIELFENISDFIIQTKFLTFKKFLSLK